MNGAIPGSSAGGEQPKFTAYCGERSAHVIVKFSPLGDDAVARRWRDILVITFLWEQEIWHAIFGKEWPPMNEFQVSSESFSGVEIRLI
jgi:hypothetical protein